MWQVRYEALSLNWEADFSGRFWLHSGVEEELSKDEGWEIKGQRLLPAVLKENQPFCSQKGACYWDREEWLIKDPWCFRANGTSLKEDVEDSWV